MIIKIATRQSKLALIQTNLVVAEIKKYFPKIQCQIVQLITSGDKITDKNLYDIGGKALFLKELEEKLLTCEVDLAVHSLKDVPGILPEGLELGAVLERWDARDCFVSYKYKSFKDLPHQSKIGSSSVRRKVVLQKMRPDLEILPCRGNVNTRLAKLQKGQFDAIILACAGLKRLNLFDKTICFPFAVDELIPSVGQGVVTVEKRINDDKMQEVCNAINHVSTWQIIEAEREYLKYFNASCNTPIAAYASYVDDSTIKAKYMYGNFEGSVLNFYEEVGHKDQAKQIALRAGSRTRF